MSDTVNIRGKAYVTVAGRVAAAHEAGGFTMPEPPELIHIGERTFCRVLIEVTWTTQRFYGTAEVKWNAPKGTADHDSPLECAETSALGRALGFAGFGSVEGIASADEVRRNEPPPPTTVVAFKSSGPWNALSDVAFRQRCNALGYRTVAQVEALVQRAASTSRADVEAVLAEEEERARLAGNGAGVIP